MIISENFRICGGRYPSKPILLVMNSFRYISSNLVRLECLEAFVLCGDS
jgi:hypothetical protein